MAAIYCSIFLVILFLGLIGQNYNISNIDYAIAVKSDFYMLPTNNHNGFSHYFEIISLNNNHPVNSQANKEDLANKGDVLNRYGNYTGAISLYDNALKIDPNYVNALDGKGWALIELGNYSESLPYLNKALTIDPNLVDALNFKGQALYYLGNISGAKYFINKAMQIDPDNVLLKKSLQNLNLNKNN